jgi:hypothetical protein
MAAMATSDSLQQKLSRYLGDVEAHEKAIADWTDQLTAITSELESTEHAKKIFSGDEKAHGLDKQLADDRRRIEKQISAGMKLAAISRKYAEETQLQIANARCSEFIGVGIEKCVSFENSLLALGPTLDELKIQMSAFDEGCAVLEKAIEQLPEWARLWMGKYFARNFAERFRHALATEINRIVSGQKAAPDFFESNSRLFSSVHRALETIQANANNGGTGRKFYRAANGAVSGVSGGLNLAHGDIIALPDDGETQRLIELGALEIVEGKR